MLDYAQLLPQDPPNLREKGLWTSAYEICQKHEKEAQNIETTDHWTPLVSARLLGYLVIHAPLRDTLCNEINNCVNLENNEATQFKLGELAKLYRDTLIRCFGNSKAPTPEDSPDFPNDFVAREKERLLYLLKQAPLNSGTSQEKALIRDQYRCMISGIYDDNFLTPRPPGYQLGFTEFCHIFSASIQKNRNNASPATWKVLESLGIEPEELCGQNIHRLENGMTLCPHIHTMMRTMRIWLEATDVPNQYTISAIEPGYIVNIRSHTITFTSSDPALPLPDPRYLHLHAVSCRVAKLSGALQAIDKISREMEQLHFLAADGGSAGTLQTVLEALAV
ncbi:hypothetical protein C8J56DRAFT_956437 [Mycena floridula]|nr:hypothetical protein C8J56DRAFT_956437 [Mycena floridula]